MDKINELLELYEVASIEELEELIKNKDEKVKDLIEFLDYYKKQEDDRSGEQ